MVERNWLSVNSFTSQCIKDKISRLKGGGTEIVNSIIKSGVLKDYNEFVFVILS